MAAAVGGGRGGAEGGGAANKGGAFPDYAEERQKIERFLWEFSAPDHGDQRRFKYRALLESVAQRTVTRVDIAVDDILMFSGDQDLVTRIQSNARRYTELFSEAIDALIQRELSYIVPDPSHEDIVDVLLQQRLRYARQAVEEEMQADVTEEEIKQLFPARMRRRYEVYVTPVSSAKPVPVREVRATDIGHLVSVKGICTRSSDVKPVIVVATYTCDSCGWEIYQEVNSRSFMPLDRCPSTKCAELASPGQLRMQTRGSKFIKYQELRVQELPDQVPVGHIPRTMTVVCRGENTRVVVPGDLISISGIWQPTPYTGFKAMKAGLIADTYLEAHSILQLKKHVDPADDDERLLTEVEAAARDPEIYSKLARSIAPEIYGVEDVKKALLLQLVGGVTQTQKDGMRIRGDINVLLVGDPGVAKSQLLKHISRVAPRAVYTTGKGSSGVGLTAAVMKDPVSGELTLEGGALVLADMGICCIDEFDKMDELDRTAIHEVMEQQTVSIAKAGITTTLNARTAVLAAANPLYGRFKRIDRDPHQNILKNVNVPAALLSRFDLIFLQRDKADPDVDRALARHVTYVHQHESHPELDFDPMSAEFIRGYIGHARQLTPYVPRALTAHIVESYVGLRAADQSAGAQTNSRGSLTPRQLLSILRMAQSLARLRFNEHVQLDDVDEAIRLTNVSKRALMEMVEDRRQDRKASYLDAIWRTLTSMFNASSTNYVDFAEARRRIARSGFSDEEFEDVLTQYARADIIEVNPSRTRIMLVENDE